MVLPSIDVPARGVEDSQQGARFPFGGQFSASSSLRLYMDYMCNVGQNIPRMIIVLSGRDVRYTTPKQIPDGRSVAPQLRMASGSTLDIDRGEP